jgi:hypothetical protein
MGAIFHCAASFNEVIEYWSYLIYMFHLSLVDVQHSSVLSGFYGGGTFILITLMGRKE